MDLSRRRLLGGLATSAATATACGRDPTPIDRRFVGQSPERGHRLRDGAIAPGPAVTPTDVDVVIVGGGAAGMAAAWRLARAGRTDVHVLELEPAIGGTARGGETARSRYPMGAHYLPAPRPSLRGLRTLLGDLGVIHGPTDVVEPDYDPRFVCGGPVERHRDRGRWLPGLYPTLDETDAERDQWRRWQDHLRSLDRRMGSDGRRLFELPVRHSSADLRDLDRKSMAAYLDELGLDSWRLRWTVDYACRDDYGLTVEQTSAFAGLHHFLSRGMEDERDRFILTWPEGNAWLVSAMAERARLGDHVHRDTVAYFIDPDTGEVAAWDAVADEHLRLRARAVLWAAPRFVLPRVLPAGRDRLPHGALRYGPWLVANVGLSRAPAGIGAPLAWDNVPLSRDNLGYVVATHTQPMTTAVQPGTVITYYEPLLADAAELADARGRLLSGSLTHWCDHVVASLEALHPAITSSITSIDVARWGHAMIRPEVGHLFSGTLARARAPLGRVIPCAADVGGLPLFEEAFSAGVLAAEEALARLQRPEATVL